MYWKISPLCARAATLQSHAFQKFVENSNIAQRMRKKLELLASYESKYQLLEVSSGFVQQDPLLTSLKTYLCTPERCSKNMVFLIYSKCLVARKWEVPELRDRCILNARSAVLRSTHFCPQNLKEQPRHGLRANWTKQPKIAWNSNIA